MLVCCGEALVDFVGVGDASRRLYRPTPGGAPFNTAIGASRLGVRTAFLGSLGADWLGDMVRARLRESAVDMTLVQTRATPTPIALVHESGEGTQYVFHGIGAQMPILEPSHIPERLSDDVDVLLIGGLATAVDPPAQAVAALARRHRDDLLVYYDPNIRPAMISERPLFMERMERLCALSSIVKISAEDAAWCYPELTAQETAEHLFSHGPQMVLLTQGGEEASALGAWGWVHVRPPRVEVKDTVGAGDTFNAGIAAALARAGASSAAAVRALDEKAVAAMLDFACAAAAVCCTHPGAEPPYLDVLERFAAQRGLSLGPF